VEWVVFLVQISIYGTIISQLMSYPGIPDYKQFYVVGLVIMTTFTVGSHTGRHFVEHAHEGRLPYMLSLPISRFQLFLSIALEGGAELALMLIVPLSVVLLLISNLTVISFTACVLALFTVGFGVAGLMLGLSFIAFKSSDMYTATVTGLSAILLRFSTVLYPFAVLPTQYAEAALFSPLTYSSDLVRFLLGFNPDILLNPYYCTAVIAAIAVSTLGLGAVLIQRLVEGVKSA
jgi:ABC-type polysaccharide/polyol phosphate export permease